MPVLLAAGCRSPFTGVDGALARWHPVDLAAEVMRAAWADAAVDPAEIDEIWVGCAEPVGAQGANLARAAVLAAGLPPSVSGAVVDRAETSGMAALHAAIAAIESGSITTALVVGVCSASIVQPGASALGRMYGRPWGDAPATRAEPEGGLLPTPVAADRAAAERGIDRARQDRWAHDSHTRRQLPRGSDPRCMSTVGARPGDRVAMQTDAPVTDDEHRAIPESPAELPPSFDPDGAVTGFSFAPPADGVSTLVVRADRAATHGARVLGTGRSAGSMRDPLGGLEAAVASALDAGSLSVDDVDRWEVAEPTAAAALLATDRLHLPEALINPDGGTLGVGDAGAAEELRLLVDPIASIGSDQVLAALAYGPGGAAVTIVRTAGEVGPVG